MPGDRVEQVSDALLEGGAMSVDAADGWAETADETPVFGEPGATVSPWLTTRLTALFPEGAEAAAVVRRALEVGTYTGYSSLAVAMVRPRFARPAAAAFAATCRAAARPAAARQ